MSKMLKGFLMFLALVTLVHTGLVYGQQRTGRQPASPMFSWGSKTALRRCRGLEQFRREYDLDVEIQLSEPLRVSEMTICSGGQVKKAKGVKTNDPKVVLPLIIPAFSVVSPHRSDPRRGIVRYVATLDGDTMEGCLNEYWAFKVPSFVQEEPEPAPPPRRAEPPAQETIIKRTDVEVRTCPIPQESMKFIFVADKGGSFKAAAKSKTTIGTSLGALGLTLAAKGLNKWGFILGGINAGINYGGNVALSRANPTRHHMFFIPGDGMDAVHVPQLPFTVVTERETFKLKLGEDNQVRAFGQNYRDCVAAGAIPHNVNLFAGGIVDLDIGRDKKVEPKKFGVDRKMPDNPIKHHKKVKEIVPIKPAKVPPKGSGKVWRMLPP